MLKKAPYAIAPSKQVRVIIDTDTGCEADDHFAIAQALMTPKFDVRAICPEHYGLRFGAHSQEDSFQEAEKVVSLMGLQGEVPVLHGCDPIAEDGSYAPSEASNFIIEEALRDDPRPLYVIILGAVTNVAVALLQRPEIAERMLIIGGRMPDGLWYFNSCNDYRAYNVLLDSPVEWWTVDMPEGMGFQASFTQLHRELMPLGALGEYLYARCLWAAEQLTARIAADAEAGRMGGGLSRAAFAAFLPGGETWAFWDCASVGLAMYDHMHCYTMRPAPRLLDEWGKTEERPDNPRLLRSYPILDSGLIMSDLFAKFHYYFD
ncbi:MAG: nucleoside hydrolase [Clostridia bacterium]|nr:nucleoside hydrolase [Clostridia bacterium]